MNKEKQKVDWIKIIGLLFGIYGFICLASNFLNPKTYQIYLSHPNENEIIFETKDNWGYKKTHYKIKFIEGSWKYYSAESGKGKWRGIPIVEGIFDPQYISDIHLDYDTQD